ncbi:MAG: Hsp20/alpha crystallin family protein [Proteobacteria bacterium]|nr:Hsp20/alpha crystallin family protein [Pseudomonadota bacterium]
MGGVRPRSYGAFRRALALPAEIDENKVDASFARDVLKITIAKQPEGNSATRKIEISAD